MNIKEQTHSSGIVEIESVISINIVNEIKYYNYSSAQNVSCKSFLVRLFVQKAILNNGWILSKFICSHMEASVPISELTSRKISIKGVPGINVLRAC